MKNNLELILLVGNWVVVAIQAFTIFLYGNSIGSVSYTHLTLPTNSRV